MDIKYYVVVCITKRLSIHGVESVKFSCTFDRDIYKHIEIETENISADGNHGCVCYFWLVGV